MTFRPMLAATLEDVEAVNYPVLVSPKIDGIRCLIHDGQPVTRKLKPIPNHYVRHKLQGLPPFDGEITVGPMDAGMFDRTQSAIMSHDGEPDFTYWVFDNTAAPDVPFHLRLDWVRSRAGMYGPMVQMLEHVPISGAKDLLT